MTSRAHQTASAQRASSAQKPSSTQGFAPGMLVRPMGNEAWFRVVYVKDAFYLRVEDLLTGNRGTVCVWDVSDWG